MAKHTPASDKHSAGRIRERSGVIRTKSFPEKPPNITSDPSTRTLKLSEADYVKAMVKGTRREILFPTEPSTIGHEKIDRAVERVVARRK